MDPQLTERIQRVEASVTLQITSKAKALQKKGIDIVNFGAGEPDFDTPGQIKEAAQQAIADGFTKYTPSSGTVELKQAICDKFKTDNGLEYTHENIVVSCGAKHSLYNVFQVLCEEGDEVIIPAPYWVSYPQFVKLAGGMPIIIDTNEMNNFILTPEKLREHITDKTKIIVLNSPSNPTGAMYTKEQLSQIAQIAVEKNITIISDEIYEKIVYDQVHYSIASLDNSVKELTVVVNGVSKAYSMTGWRIGYLAAVASIAQAVNKLQSQSTSNPTSISQVAAQKALTADQSCVTRMVDAFKERRDYLVSAINSIDGLQVSKPTGAFYAFVNISSCGISSMDFTSKLLEASRVAVIPGIAFGSDEYIRLSYATSMNELKKGVERIKEFVSTLK
ncbi:pyridoxal phosphate-dependent aminotransferase [Chlamydiota bacterium]